MIERKVYSLNLAAYCCDVGYEYELVEDAETPGKYCFVFDQDISPAKLMYKEDVRLNNFIRAYRRIRSDIRERRFGIDG